jgi:hypothetical protein
VFVYQPGTTTDFTGTAYNAKSGGSSISNGFVTNSQGEAEAWFDTPQSVDIAVTDNSGTAYYPAAPSTLIPFAPITEANWDLEPAREDRPISIGVVGDITTVTNAVQTALAGATGRWTDAGHRHAKEVSSANPHGVGDHFDTTRTLFLPINDGVVLDGGTLTTIGTAPDIIRVITLADAASQGGAWAVTLDDYTSGAISYQIYFSPLSAVLAANVRWSVDCKSVAGGGGLAAAGTTTTLTHTGTSEAVNSLIKGTLTSSTVTPGSTTDLFMINVRRLGGDGLDTFAGTINLVGVLLSYGASQ